MITTFLIGVDAGAHAAAGLDTGGAGLISIDVCMVQRSGDCQALLIQKSFGTASGETVRSLYWLSMIATALLS